MERTLSKHVLGKSDVMEFKTLIRFSFATGVISKLHKHFVLFYF